MKPHRLQPAAINMFLGMKSYFICKDCHSGFIVNNDHAIGWYLLDKTQLCNTNLWFEIENNLFNVSLYIYEA